MNAKPPQSLFDKINALPADLVTRVEAFVDSLRTEDPDRTLTRAASRASEAALAKIWSNPEDDVYDRL